MDALQSCSDTALLCAPALAQPPRTHCGWRATSGGHQGYFPQNQDQGFSPPTGGGVLSFPASPHPQRGTEQPRGSVPGYGKLIHEPRKSGVGAGAGGSPALPQPPSPSTAGSTQQPAWGPEGSQAHSGQGRGSFLLGSDSKRGQSGLFLCPPPYSRATSLNCLQFLDSPSLPRPSLSRPSDLKVPSDTASTRSLLCPETGCPWSPCACPLGAPVSLF